MAVPFRRTSKTKKRMRRTHLKKEVGALTKCPSCGEEVTSDIRFPDGVGALFHVQSKRRRFGKK